MVQPGGRASVMHDVAKARYDEVRLERRSAATRLSPVATPDGVAPGRPLAWASRALAVVGALLLLIAWTSCPSCSTCWAAR